MTLGRIYSLVHTLSVSQATIYAQLVGELCNELITDWCQDRNKHATCRKNQDKRGQTTYVLSIHVRLPEVKDRQFPVQWGVPDHWRWQWQHREYPDQAHQPIFMFVKATHPKTASVALVGQVFTDNLNAIAQHGRDVAMRTHIAWFASTSPKAPFCRATHIDNWTKSPIKSIIDLANV